MVAPSKSTHNATRKLYNYIARKGRALSVQPATVKVPVRIRKPYKVKQLHWPVLHLSSWLRTSMEEFGGFLFLGGKTLDNIEEVHRELATFWERYAFLDTRPPPSDPRVTIPIQVHGDEGRGQVKRPLMIIAFQGILGWCLHEPEEHAAADQVRNSSKILGLVLDACVHALPIGTH